MKRVLYNTCAIDPWINVAKKLKNQNGWEPVYWVEYTFDNAYYYAKKTLMWLLRRNSPM